MTRLRSIVVRDWTLSRTPPRRPFRGLAARPAATLTAQGAARQRLPLGLSEGGRKHTHLIGATVCMGSGANQES